MLEQIKVLNGILALEQFTVAELAGYTEVKVPTVYTVLDRRRHLLDSIGSERTGRRGGQYVRYQLKSEAVDEIRAEIAKAAAAVASERRPFAPEEASSSLNLEATEEFLTYRIPKAKSAAEKRGLLKTSEVYLTAAQKEFREHFEDRDTAFTRERASRLKALSGLHDAIEAEIKRAEISEAEAQTIAAKVDPRPLMRRFFARPDKPSFGRALQIGDPAPDFEANTTQGRIRFYDWIGNSWAVLFSHPKDFTPVSTTEIGYMARIKPEFDKRNVKIIGLSVDPVETHLKWANKIMEIQGFAPSYPMIGDTDLTISRLYGMLPAISSGDQQTVRNVFVIGLDKKIKLVLVYPMTTGRNVDEVLRVIDSLQLTAQHKVATPVNWKQGEDVIIAGSVSDDEARKMFPQGWKTSVSSARFVRPR